MDNCNIIKENDFVYFENKHDLKKIRKVSPKENIFIRKYKLNINTSKFIGLKYNKWYNINGEEFIEIETKESIEIETKGSIEIDTTKSMETETKGSIEIDTKGSIEIETKGSIDIINPDILDNSDTEVNELDVQLEPNKRVKSTFTVAKYELKKKDKKSRQFIIYKVEPSTLLEFLRNKSALKIHYFTHPELAYISMFGSPYTKTLLFDDCQDLITYTFIYKYGNYNIECIKSSKKKIEKTTTPDENNSKITKIEKKHENIVERTIKYTNSTIKTFDLYTDILNKYSLVIICSRQDIIKILQFYDKNITNNLIIRTNLKEYGNEIFDYLLKSNIYINIKMSEFLFREYQTQHVHPLFRGNFSGFVLTATKINKKG
ncbi:hypothetical protein CWI37_2065p0010 [Hamiltosporidium tvaerminnensis]|uniref:tRNA (adenine(58)-N(1))-methyltransferase non-catalytic subunit TRM6 n=1 Tax=Hamiltosporidium tvaerminnensis TaxID=1176355 RepID=A0A4Q9KSM9_9MICR|nr:hypothetical protein CWI37_2065p0010 [Hamiltosporidium tvaerminnensis]